MTLEETPILERRILCHQPVKGYRFAVDSLLLPWFTLKHSRPGSFLEPCSGCGVISAILLTAWPDSKGTSVELNEVLHEASNKTAAVNGLSTRWSNLHGDLRNISKGDLEPVDLVIANPPFYPLDKGRQSPDPMVAGARHEVHADKDDLLGFARRLLRPGRSLYITYPAERLPEILAALVPHGFGPIRLQLVHPRADQPANRFLLQAERSAKSPLEILPPVIVHDVDGYGVWYSELEELVVNPLRSPLPSPPGCPRQNHR
jgi:tRNA1Val (adenine37-N6)-methyltransferase